MNWFLEKGILQENKALMNEVADLVSGMLSECGKNNPHLQKIVLTGILDTVKKEDNSGFNNVVVFGIMDAKFSKHFGFSQEEVDQLIRKLNFEEGIKGVVSKNIKDWYNGYSVPIGANKTIEVYTPWAVMNYLSDVYTVGQLKPQNHWTQSGAADMFEALLTREICFDTNFSSKFKDITAKDLVPLEFSKKISLFRYDPNPLLIMRNSSLIYYLMQDI